MAAIIPAGIQALIRAIGPKVGQAASRVARSRFGQGTGGALRASETPTGILTAMEGVEEDSGLQTGLGAGLALSGLTQLVPGARNVSQLFRRRTAKTIPGKRAESDKFSRQDAMLRNTQKQLEDAPGIGGLFRAERKRPFTTQAALIGGGTAIGAGVDQYNDRVLGDPVDFSSLGLSREEAGFPKSEKEEKPIPKTEQKVIKDSITNIEARREQELDNAETSGLGPQEIQIINEKYDAQKKNAELLYEQSQTGDPAIRATDYANIKPLTAQVGQEAGGVITQPGEGNSNVKLNNNDPEAVSIATDQAGKMNILSFEEYEKRLSPQTLSPEDNIAQMKYINQSFESSFRAIQEARDNLNDRKKQSFDEFYNEFKTMTGGDDDKGRYHALFKLGTSLMNSRSYDGGLSGFLANLGEAGGEAGDMLYRMYEQDKSLRRSLASNYIEHNRALEQDRINRGRQLTDTEINLAKDIATLGLQFNEQEKTRRAGLAESYLKYETDLKIANIENASKGQKVTNQRQFFVPESSPNTIMGGGNTITVATDANGGLVQMVQEIGPNGQPTGRQKPVPIQGDINNMNEVDSTAKGLYKKSQERLASNALAQRSIRDYVRLYNDNPDVFNQATGTAGRLVQVKGIISSLFKGGALNLAGINMYEESDNLQDLVRKTEDDDKILQDLEAKIANSDEADEIRAMYQKDLANRMKVGNLKSIAKEYKISSKMFDEDAQVQIAVAKIAVMEHRMKYLVANSLKADDRLTVKDVEAAEKNTKIIGLFTDPQKTLRGLEDELLPTLQLEFKRQVGLYKQGGGNDAFLIGNYPSIKYVENFMDKKSGDVSTEEEKAIINKVTSRY